jgi:hypothetical protein
VAIVDIGIEMLLGSWNVQVLGMIDDEEVSPERRSNPDVSGNISDRGGGRDSSVDVESESLETIILETQPSTVEGAARRIPTYFLVMEIQHFLLHEKFGTIGFEKGKSKFNIQLRPGVRQFMEFCTANFEVVFWSCEVDERMEAQYDRLVQACPSLSDNPDRPKFGRHWCDMSTAINPRTTKADIALKRLSRLFCDTRALGGTDANSDNTLLIDPFARTCVLNDPYNAFHPTIFTWNSENDEPGLPYLLRVVQPFLEQMKESGLPVQQYCARNDRVGWRRLLPGDPERSIYSDVVAMDRQTLGDVGEIAPWIVKKR